MPPAPPDKTPGFYSARLVELTEFMATEIAYAFPDWCRIAEAAEELAAAAAVQCAAGTDAGESRS
jgi:hypothetical protein